MPAPGTGGVQTSLTGMVQGMMARARAAFRRKPGPTPGAPIQSPGGNPPDLTQFSETFEPSGGLFDPGYPTGEDADETGIAAHVALSWIAGEHVFSIASTMRSRRLGIVSSSGNPHQIV